MPTPSRDLTHRALDLADENVGFACAAAVSILRSALKSNTPANRAIVKHTRTDETIEVVEYSAADSVPWHKQFPLSGGDYVRKRC